MQQNINSKPLVSIIIPCYNASRFIKQTLISILSQDIKDVEIILIDDGSTDNTRELIPKNEGKISYFYQSNKGVSYSRNRGLALSNGKYVIFFDADDLMSDNFLGARLNILNNESDIGFVCGKLRFINETGQLISELRLSGYSENIIQNILFYDKTITTCPSNYLIRKSLLKKNNIIFNEKLSSVADKLFLCELGYHGKGFLTDSKDSDLLYRKHSGNMSGKKNYSDLVNESEKFINEVIENDYFGLSNRNSNAFLQKNYFLLFKSFLKILNFKKSLFYLLKLYHIKLKRAR